MKDICGGVKRQKEYCQNNHIPLEIIPYTQYNQLSSILNEILLKYKIK